MTADTLKIRPLNDALKKVAKEELNEVESRIAEDIEALRTWLEKQPHIKARTDDQFLVSFLRGCKYSLEKTKSKVDYFYTIKTMMPELFARNTMDEKSINLCRSGTYVRLPKPLGEGGPRIQLTNYSKFDPKLFTIMDLFRFQNLLMDWQIYNDDNCIVSGYIEIIDLTKLSLSFLTQFDPMLIKKLGVFTEKAAPMRFKGVHLVNCPKEAQTVLNLARSMMSEKLQKRFYVHKSLEDLYKIIPKEYLPVEYGGTNGTIPELIEETEKNLLALNEYFAEEDKYGVDERLRTGKKVDMDSLFGIEGSFRKLDID
ncbi:alpha-tocopherol transfer protein-like [Musca vetustissima]|uniref:alpha-tocopherol transfer protein-like n=1 Tax=Musca vetustissima TaxID=27455 RepID=UPI002AB5EE0F|nr:alpha-tocopherol transfer protein-like [Musca vetustissima]